MKTCEISAAEERVKEYYNNLKIIEKLKYQLDTANKQKIDIQRDIDNSNINLTASVQAVTYDKTRVQTNSIVSVQEAEIERVFNKLEKQLEYINVKIVDINLEMRKLEDKNSEIEFIINSLNDESKQILNFIYRDKKTLREISNRLNLDSSNIGRKKDSIITDIARWIYFY